MKEEKSRFDLPYKYIQNDACCNLTILSVYVVLTKETKNMLTFTLVI